MPEFFKKSFIAVVVFILVVLLFNVFTKKNYVECRSFVNKKDFDIVKDNPSTYLPKVYEINNSCIAILKKKNKAATPPCTAMDHLFFNITLMNYKDTDRAAFHKHLDKADDAMQSYSYCRKQAEYLKWVNKFKAK